MAAAKDKRLYARFDIGMDEHPKIMLLSDAAFRALHEATYYSRRQLTDGFLDERVVRRKWRDEVIEELCSNHAERPSLFQVEGGWQIRDYSEHQTTTADIEAKREAGRRGGQARVSNLQAGAQAGASNVLKQNAKQTATAPQAITETETETETLKASAPAVLVSESDFERAWDPWPKTVERKKSLDKFKAAAKKRGVEALIADITRFGDAYARTTEKQYVPALNVWLNGERWTDELPGVHGGAPAAASMPGADIRNGIRYVSGKPVIGGPDGMTPEQYNQWRDNRGATN